MSGGSPVQRVRRQYVEQLFDRLSERDWQILENLRKVRVLTGSQIERLAFADLVGRSRSVVRWRVLKRLADWRVVTTLDRRIGGAARGSSGVALTLDTAGYALLHLRDGDQAEQLPRRPSTPGDRFIRHVLTTSELYVQTVEAARAGDFSLDMFLAEPQAWLADGLGGWLKPDAFLSLSSGELVDDWFAEIDLATEHIPTLRRKAETYLDFWKRGQLGQNGVMPRVLISVPDDHRREAVQAMFDQLPEQAKTLLHVTTHLQAVPYLVRMLRE